MLSFITRNKITEGRPIRSKLDSSGSKTAASMKWIQPSGRPLVIWLMHGMTGAQLDKHMTCTEGIGTQLCNLHMLLTLV